MASVFYIIGAIVTAAGLGWSWLIFARPIDGVAPGAITVERMIATAPGLSIALAGLLLLAVGGVLARLDRIERNTRRD